MTTKATTRNDNGKRIVWKIPGQRGEGNAIVESNNQENPSKLVLGVVSHGGRDEKRIECQLYQRGRCHYGDQCKYAHVLPSDSQPLAPLSGKTGKETRGLIASDGSALIPGNSRERTRTTDNSHNYPIRNGAADCQYYLKTGKCNYGSRCKFNHPFRDESLVNALNRRDCFDFVQRGTCPYGRSCKYNHPTSSESIFSGYDNHSSSSTDSSSSPRSVSRSRHRRSASEPRCPTRREAVQEPVSVSQEKLVSNQSYAHRTQTVQALSKWDTSLDAKHLSNDKKQFDSRSQRSINLVVPVQTPVGSMPALNDAWNRGETPIRVPERPFPTSTNIEHRLGEVMPNAPDKTGIEAHIRPAFVQANAAPGRQHYMDNSRVASSQELPRSDMPSTSGWIQTSATPGGAPFRELPAVAPTASLLQRAESHVTNSSEVHSLQAGSIWRSDFPVDRKENIDNAACASLDLGRLSSQLDPSTVRPTLQAAQERLHVEGDVWGGVKAGHRRAHSLSSSTLPLGLPSMSSGYSLGNSSFGDDYVRNESLKTQSVQSAWGAPNSSAMASLDLGINTSEMQRLRRQQQIQAYQQHHQQYAQIQTQEEKILRQMQQLGKFPGPGGFSVEYPGSLGINDNGGDENVSLNAVAHDGYGVGQLQIPRDDIAAKSSNESWNSRSFDPMRYKASLFGRDFLGQRRPIMTENVWKPIEKSSIFGPGLFGMEHL